MKIRSNLLKTKNNYNLVVMLYNDRVVEGSAPLDWVSIDDKGEIKTTEVEIDAEQFSVLNYKVIASDSSSSQEETVS